MRLLLVESDQAHRAQLVSHLASEGHVVVDFENAGPALDRIGVEPFDHAVVDIGATDGSVLIRRLHEMQSGTRIVVVATEPSAALELVHGNGGRSECLIKPFTPDALRAALTRLSGFRTVAPPAVDLEGWRRAHVPDMLGQDPKLLRVFEVMRRVAESDCSVLVTGETGTGKELVAAGLHRASARARGPFVAVNCAAIPETLMESELFGHARGAFTGAHVAQKGRFAHADGGTLLLDEVGEMPPALQAKLLRVLQEGTIHPIGESRPLRIDVRVIAATHRDLEEMVAAGTFRDDLLYRLDVIRIELPPLRARRGDIPVLIAAFLAQGASRRRVPIPRLDEAALELLCAYDWPGNVRQLHHVVERLLLLTSSNVITAEDLPARIRDAAPRSPSASGRNEALPRLPDEGVDLRDAVEQFENALILQALERTGWNKNQAAAMLHLNRTTLVEKLKKRGWSR